MQTKMTQPDRRQTDANTIIWRKSKNISAKCQIFWKIEWWKRNRFTLSLWHFEIPIGRLAQHVRRKTIPWDHKQNEIHLEI